jgi:hypothetical protein
MMIYAEIPRRTRNSVPVSSAVFHGSVERHFVPSVNMEPEPEPEPEPESASETGCGYFLNFFVLDVNSVHGGGDILDL